MIGTPSTCSVEDCDRPYYARGFCGLHYQRFKRAGLLPTLPSVPRSEQCSIPDCQRRRLARGLCSTHYARWWKYGDPLTVMPKVGNRKRRPEVHYEGQHRRVRVDRGPASEHLCVDCGGPASHWSYVLGCSDELVEDVRGRSRLPFCPHVDHYEPRCTTCHARYDADNRTQCSRGHPWIPENLYVKAQGRACRICSQERRKQRQEPTTNV